MVDDTAAPAAPTEAAEVRDGGGGGGRGGRAAWKGSGIKRCYDNFPGPKRRMRVYCFRSPPGEMDGWVPKPKAPVERTETPRTAECEGGDEGKEGAEEVAEEEEEDEHEVRLFWGSCRGVGGELGYTTYSPTETMPNIFVSRADLRYTQHEPPTPPIELKVDFGLGTRVVKICFRFCSGGLARLS